MPEAWDLTELAHGALQQSYDDALCLLALLRADAADEAVWLERLRQAIDPSRHALLPLRATLPGFYALFEHDALLDALLLHQLEREDRDPSSWPGRGRESALYLAAPPPPGPAASAAGRPAPAGHGLDALVWPELAARDPRTLTAVVPLGAAEQHGPHLPFATDTWIAEALAAALCARVPGCLHLPALPIGVSPEHLDFPGTLSLRAESFTQLLSDLVASLARHGFAGVFLFSAHGGNAEPLRAALPALREAARAAARVHGLAAPRVWAHTDLTGLTRALQRAAADAGVPAGAAGHHAGEVETSLLLALRPAGVRRGALAAGTEAPCADAQALFYPSLRPNAPNGVVGDPRPADAARGARYLEAWVAELVACFEEGASA